MRRMPPAPEQPTAPAPHGHEDAPQRPTRLVLTRRGRLVRTILCALALLLVIVLLTQLIRAITSPDPAPESPQEQVPAVSDGGGDPSDGGGVQLEGGPVDPEDTTEDEDAEDLAEGLRRTESGLIRSEDKGTGEFTTAAVSDVEASEAATVRRYLVRVEEGLDLDADAVADEVAGILADERGWHDLHDVAFEQVTDVKDAEFILTVASPPTTDQLCLPANTMGIWSCRVREDVVLNSDRWSHLTPTYDDPAEYRAYLVNHEVGHFLGHGHESCGGEGLAAPVMMQQSKGLQGCTANAWPTRDGQS